MSTTMHRFFYISLVLFIFANSSRSQRVQNSSVYRSLTSIRDCLSNRYPVVCFKERALDMLNETLNNDKPLVFYDMVEISRNPQYSFNNTDDSNIPEELSERSVKLNDLLHNKIEEFFKSRTIKFNMAPAVEEGDDDDYDDSDDDELTDEARHNQNDRGKFLFNSGSSRGGGRRGRKKGDKGKGGGGMMMMGMIGMGCMMAQMMMGKVAFLAGTALIIAKVALFLSAIVGLKKLSGGGGGGESTSHVVYATSDHGHGGGGGGWHRSLDGQAAQSMAYRAYNDNNTSDSLADRRSIREPPTLCTEQFHPANQTELKLWNAVP